MIATVLSTANIAFDAPNASGTNTVAAGGTATLNADSGVITITGLTAAAGTTETATVNNSKVIAKSRVLATINKYTGSIVTNGVPVIATIDASTVGTIKITIANLGANALNGDVEIAFAVGQEIV